MVFEARYRKSKLLGLASIGLLFVALGLWMALRPSGSFEDSRKIRSLAHLIGSDTDTAGHGIGWLSVLFGVAFLPSLARQARWQGPAIRVDEHGIYWHRWSPKPIGWGNIVGIQPTSIYNQKMVTLTLGDPSLDRGTGLLGKAARLNNSLGFGQIAVSVQGTDADFDELVAAIFHHAELHGRTARGTV